MQASGQQSLALPLEYSSTAPEQGPTWRFRFEDFVVGSCNQLAYAACTSVCQEDFPADNIFLSSPPGLGKTHLMQSIGNHLCSRKKDSSAKIAYLLSEQFGNQMVQALKSREIEKFKSRYRDNVDLLLLEDIHFFQGKAKMQEELLSVVKSLLENGNKVVFTSSFLPKELDKVDSQLTSYFCSGLLTPIQKPDFDLRLRLVEKKAQRYQLKIPSKMAELIATTITSDIRQLESCIQNLVLKSRLLQQEITPPLVREVLQNYARSHEEPDLNQIIRFVCEVFELPLAKLKSQSRKRQVVMARNTAFYLARKYTDLSLKDIGQHFNRRHSTVLKGITCLEREMQRNSAAGQQLLRIMDKMEQ
jgi:chromosomal replication initiator protein